MSKAERTVEVVEGERNSIGLIALVLAVALACMGAYAVGVKDDANYYKDRYETYRERLKDAIIGKTSNTRYCYDSDPMADAKNRLAYERGQIELKVYKLELEAKQAVEVAKADLEIAKLRLEAAKLAK